MQVFSVPQDGRIATIGKGRHTGGETKVVNLAPVFHMKQRGTFYLVTLCGRELFMSDGCKNEKG